VLIHEFDKSLRIPFGIHRRNLLGIVLKALEEGLSTLERVVLLKDVDDTCPSHHKSQGRATGCVSHHGYAM